MEIRMITRRSGQGLGFVHTGITHEPGSGRFACAMPLRGGAVPVLIIGICAKSVDVLPIALWSGKLSTQIGNWSLKKQNPNTKLPGRANAPFFMTVFLITSILQWRFGFGRTEVADHPGFDCRRMRVSDRVQSCKLARNRWKSQSVGQIQAILSLRSYLALKRACSCRHAIHSSQDGMQVKGGRKPPLICSAAVFSPDRACCFSKLPDVRCFFRCCHREFAQGNADYSPHPRIPNPGRQSAQRRAFQQGTGELLGFPPVAEMFWASIEGAFLGRMQRDAGQLR